MLRARSTSFLSAATAFSPCSARRPWRGLATKVGFVAIRLALLVGVLPVTVVAQTPADYYWWRALERAERGDLAEAGEDLRSAARSTSDPEFAFAVTSARPSFGRPSSVAHARSPPCISDSARATS